MLRGSWPWPYSVGRTGVTSLAVSPGWMRTEFVLMGHNTDEQHWRERAQVIRDQLEAMGYRPDDERLRRCSAARERRRQCDGGRREVSHSDSRISWRAARRMFSSPRLPS